MEPPTYFLCASCGCEVRMDYYAPWFGLCEFCEEKCRETVVSWPVKEKETNDEDTSDDIAKKVV
jgi:hypothetical protein